MGAPPWGITKRGELQAAADRCSSNGARVLVEGVADSPHLRPGGCDEPGRGGDDREEPAAYRGEAQVQAVLNGRCGRGSSFYGRHVRRPNWFHHLSTPHGVDRQRNAEGSHGSKREEKSSGRKGLVEKGRQRQQRREVRSCMSSSSWTSSTLWCIFIFACIQPGACGGVDGGDLQGDRQRNIFPLPQFSSDGQSGSLGIDWVSMVNRGINALNVLSGCANSQFSQQKPTRVQCRALKHISDSFKDVCSVVETDPGRSCLEDLCSSSRLYQADRSDVVSYARELVSWPKVETRPIPICECLPCTDLERLATWRQHTLKPPESLEVEGCVKRPYTDPIPKHKYSEYVGFIQELQRRHMVGFKTDIDDAGELGIFFVRKKNGSQRLFLTPES